MTTTVFTSGVTLSNTDWATDVDTTAYAALTSVAGTANAITATGPANYTHAAGRFIRFLPGSTNTGATGIVITPSGGAALASRNIFWNGVACVGDEIRANIPCLLYDDGTQLNIVGAGFNPPFLDTHPVVVGGTDRTKKVRIEVDGLTTGTTRVLTMPDADVTLASSATQAEQETGSSTTVYVSPGRQQFHPSGAKGWVHSDTTGGIQASYNVTSVTDNGTGDWTVNWGTDFSSAAFCALAETSAPSASATVAHTDEGSRAAGTTRVVSIVTTTGVKTDPNQFFCASFGDQ